MKLRDIYTLQGKLLKLAVRVFTLQFNYTHPMPPHKGIDHCCEASSNSLSCSSTHYLHPPPYLSNLFSPSKLLDVTNGISGSKEVRPDT